MQSRAFLLGSFVLGCSVSTALPAQSPGRDGVGRYASCRRLESVGAYVEIDASRRLHICARAGTNNIGPYLATPVVRQVGDTVYVSAVVELPRGESLLMTEVSWVAYQVFLGPYSAGSRIRVTTRPFGSSRSTGVALDTVVRVP